MKGLIKSLQKKVVSNHSKINFDITDENDGVENSYVRRQLYRSDNTKYMGRVVYDTDTFDQSLEAKENGDVTIDI